MRQQFKEWKPRGEAATLVQTIDTICRDYASQGYELTVRQLYYQLVSRAIITNDARSYKRIVSVTDSARLAGLLDWSYIVDRTRNAYGTDGMDTTPEDAIRSTAGEYALPLWNLQPNHVEVWVEKEALAGIVQQAASGVQCVYFACRGYVSQSEMYAAGRRFRSYGQRGKQNYVIHLGDHDPSGIDMTRDIEDRLTMFAGAHAPEVRRIALNMDQVEQYGPPPNFAKTTDARYEGYATEFGTDSWELDALDPATLSALISDEVLSLRDEVLWQEAEAEQYRDRVQLQTIADNFDEIVDTYA